MQYSLDWIKRHVIGDLPDTETLVASVTISAFEVEETETKGKDTVMEIKVLPDRAHDALSHRGMAREIVALTPGLKRKEIALPSITRDASVAAPRVTIADPSRCMRYIATRIDGVTIAPSGDALRHPLEAIGARSISNLVDVTNFVLFDMGQPLHVFDADKVSGGITVRLAKKGETMTTLDSKELALDGTELVIADDEAVLALAGVKGGKKAEVDANTKSVILEAANFDPTTTRKTTVLHNIKTDASKRYENGITSAFAEEATALALALIALHGGKDVRIGASVDVHPTKESPVSLTVTAHDVNRLVGVGIDEKGIEAILTQGNFSFERSGDSFTVAIPPERLDLRLTEDMIEEIGRRYGYDKAAPTVPSLAKKGIPNKRLFYANKARRFLTSRGFSEVFTYSFARPGNGEIEVLYPVGKDRPFVRKDLMVGIKDSLMSNLYNAPLIGIEEVRIFEIGNVFPLSGERMKLALGIAPASKARAKAIAEEARSLAGELASALGATLPELAIPNIPPEGILKYAPAIVELDLDALIEKLPEPTLYEPLRTEDESTRYRSLSIYPFIVRDIAIFVPESVKEEYIEDLLKKEAGELVVRFSQFDKFQKPGESRISYGYRMVFQSFAKTLTDDEIGTIMERVTATCNAQEGWEVR